MNDPPGQLLLSVTVAPDLRAFRIHLAGRPGAKVYVSSEGLNWHLTLFHRLFELFYQHQLWREPLPGEGDLSLLVPIIAACKPAKSAGPEIQLTILENQTRVVIRKVPPHAHIGFFTLLQLELQSAGRWWTG